MFPASEGFLPTKIHQKETGMLLLLNSEFSMNSLKADEFFTENPKRYTIGEAELGVNYVLIISTNAGLLGYNIGDTIQFTELKTISSNRFRKNQTLYFRFWRTRYRKRSGISTKEAMEGTDVRVNEFTVAPQITPTEGLPYHEWFIEFENEPTNLEDFALKIDAAMRKQNVYYDDLISWKCLKQEISHYKVFQNGFQ